ncbi:hypothetical protein MTO96_050091, partial [Rhipicephalus appendiculatus]
MRAAVPYPQAVTLRTSMAWRSAWKMYDAAIAPVAPTVAALLDSFGQAFLNSADLHVGSTAEEGGHKERTQFIDVGCGSG